MSDPESNPSAPSGPIKELSGRIGKYDIVKPLGKGAMGIVYLAHDTILKTPTTLPSTCTYGGYMGSSESFSGCSRIRPFSR